MATTYVRGAQNTYGTATTGGTGAPGDAATGHIERYIWPWADALEPLQTQILNKIKKGPAVNNTKVEQGQHRNTVYTGTVTAYTSGAATLVLAAGQAARIQKYQVIEVEADSAGGTREIFWVSAEPNADNATLTVTGARGGTSASNHALGAVWRAIGIAEPDLVDHVLGPVTYGDFTYNLVQRFGSGIKIDDFANKVPNLEFGDDHLPRQVKQKQIDLKKQLELACLKGGRDAGDPNAGTPRLMGGVNYFIPSGNQTNLASALLSVYDLEQIIYDRWVDVDDNKAMDVLMNLKTKRILSSLKNNGAQVMLNDTTLNLRLDAIDTDVGVIRPMVFRDIPDGEIWGINWDDVSLHPAEGQDWHIFQHVTNGDYSWRSISGQFTLRLQKTDAIWKLYGFDTTLANYPRNVA
jgi:hypothetical protein